MEKLLAPGSIPELEMRRYVLEKDTLRLFSIRAKQSPRCGGQPEERLSIRLLKSALQWCG